MGRGQAQHGEGGGPPAIGHGQPKTAGAAVRPKTELSADNRPDKCFGEHAAAKDLRFEKPHQKDRQSNIKIVQE